MSKISCRDHNKNAVYADGSPKKPNWGYRFYGTPINGKPTPFSKTGFATEDEAMRAGIKAMEEYTHSGPVFRESRMSYADCLQSWPDNYVTIRCTDTTKAGYEKRILNYIQPVLGKYRLTTLKHDSVQTFINSMLDRHFSRNTLSSLLGIITSSLRYAKRQGWIRKNPRMILTCLRSGNREPCSARSKVPFHGRTWRKSSSAFPKAPQPICR